MISPPDTAARKFSPRRTTGYYCLAGLLLLGLFICLVILLPQVRQFILFVIEQSILHRELRQPQRWIEGLFRFALAGFVFMILFGFLLLTSPGRKLVNKMELADKTNSRIGFDIDKLKDLAFSDKFFTGISLAAGFVAVSIAFFRAANTGITCDEAYTYLHYILPNIFDSVSKNQALNNHFLNTFCIRVVMFFSQSKYNELIIRFPNLVFYCVYLFFSYLTAKQYKNRFLIFTLFISNYYLNEFFGLARGYGMACACITAACYFFEKWKLNYTSKKADTFHFLCFMVFCSLGTLSNSITLYIVLGFLIIINFKYRKDLLKLSYSPFFIIFFLTALYTVMVTTRGREYVYSTYSIYSCIMSIPNMFSNSKYLTFLIALFFFLSFIYLMIRTRAKDDFCWILAIFSIICIVSQFVFYRGYPVLREMIPFYPVFVIIIANALKYVPNRKITKLVFAVCIAALCFQFFLKMDTKSTREWNDNYPIRDIVYTYMASNDIIINGNEFLSFIETNQESSSGGGNQVFAFYAGKAELLMKNTMGD